MPSKPINNTIDMKKFTSLLITFVIVLVLVAGGSYLLGIHNSDPMECILTGIFGALGATIADLIEWKFKK